MYNILYNIDNKISFRKIERNIIMVFKREIIVSKNYNKIINKYLNLQQGLSESEYQGEDSTIRYTATFPYGIEMDIKCCGCKDSASWTEAVLFDNGFEVCCSEVSDNFLGKWEFKYKNNTYITEVILGK